MFMNMSSLTSHRPFVYVRTNNTKLFDNSKCESEPLYSVNLALLNSF